MSDQTRVLRRNKYAAPIAAGLASGALYSTILLSFTFLLPVQIAYGRSGRRVGGIAAGMSILGIGIAVLLFARATGTGLGGFDGMRALGSALLTPVLLLVAIVLLNSPLARGWDPSYRVLAVTGLCALAVSPFIVALLRDTKFSSALESVIGEYIVKPFRAAVSSAGSTEGFDGSVLAISLDAKELASSFIETIADSFAAILFCMIGGSWRIGNRLSGKESPGRAQTVPIEGIKLPYPLLWAFLVSWAMVLAGSVLQVPGAARAIAWNCALTLSIAYAAQGYGIFTYLFKKWNMPRSMRIVVAILSFVSMVATTVGFVVAIALPLFGVTEIWINYRKPKGVGA